MITVSTLIFDEGLSKFTQAFQLCVCQGEPLTASDVNNTLSNGGKRVTPFKSFNAGEIAISDGFEPASRAITIPNSLFDSSVLENVSLASADLYVACIAGADILLKSDQVQSQQLVVGATLQVDAFEYGIKQ